MRKAPRFSAPSRSLTAGSFTITNSQFCALLPVGALSASSITRSTSPSSTGSGLSRRIARWVRIASSSGIEKSGAAVGGAGLVSSMLGLLGADQSTTRARAQHEPRRTGVRRVQEPRRGAGGKEPEDGEEGREGRWRGGGGRGGGRAPPHARPRARPLRLWPPDGGRQAGGHRHNLDPP